MNIEHEYTKNIVCPFCGYADKDSWEFNHDYGEKRCPVCDRDFIVSRNVSVDYSTIKIPKLKTCSCGCEDIDRLEVYVKNCVYHGCQCSKCHKESEPKFDERESWKAWGIVEESEDEE